MSMGTQRRRLARRRQGLAPLELVLWLPLLLFVMALMVNFGTAAAWRLRGEVIARDEVWRELGPRRAFNDLPPAWPDDAQHAVDADAPYTRQLEMLPNYATVDDVVRGEGESGQFRGVGVERVLDPDQLGARLGKGSIVRPFPLLPILGRYESGPIQHRILQRMWPRWEHGLVRNAHRRTKTLYQPIRQWRDWEQPYRRAGDELHGFLARVQDELALLDTFRPSPADAGHRELKRLCTTAPQRVMNPALLRAKYLQGSLVDFLDDDGNIQLGAITRLPRTMTEHFLRAYERRLRYLENRTENLRRVMPQTAEIGQQITDAQAEIAALRPKIDQLQQYGQRLPGIEKELQSTSTAPWWGPAKAASMQFERNEVDIH